MPPLVIHTDCRRYRTDRPCEPHKQRGRVCETCPEYDRIEGRILIVKLDAVGDVLRTTSLLTPLKVAYPRSRVTWITRPQAVDVLKPNRMIDEVLPLDVEALLVLQTETFDLVLSPDASITSCRLATLARAGEKRGFTLDERGGLVALNAAARRWYEMGVDDTLKRQNRQTYQAILLDICELPVGEHPVLWEVSSEEEAFAREFAARRAVQPERFLNIGLNTGAGGRWRWKKWTEEGYAALIDGLLRDYPRARVLLYGGPEERERNETLERIDNWRVVNTGCGNTLRQFGALVDLCHVMVTGDTMALHLAAALGKRIVALFGPTSLPEVELYALGTKLAPEMPCLGCYLSDCDVRPACMERIVPAEVLGAVRRQVGLLEPVRAPVDGALSG